MIAFLRGRLAGKQPNRIIVDVAGVGFDVAVPLSTFYKLQDEGSDVALWIHTHVREDAIALYGFSTGLEQQIFERLIGIGGIGPKLALAVLSGIDVADLVRAVRAGDVARLTAIPGIGRKTAERIGLELKDKLPDTFAADLAADESGAGADGGLRGDLLSALLNLGYHRPLAERAVDAALARAASPTFEAALKQALRELARR
ncbi:MAG TPA: Holliday junction branch migration protein RuvA [Vicinamibacterales bacterium]|nr:Holliday junction branch migration protein RuvA [Vicinamibacterales bacterium]HOQ61145.1 Holliday junction branch migration protein RuvA [Vicinamibacterales bacterium]HPK72362.1 Holliday junction branch migration protein RuvA [Vicinamibacterales bacterium]